MFSATEEASDTGRPSKDLPAFPGYPPEQKALQEYVLAARMKFKRLELESFIADPGAEPPAMGRFKAVPPLVAPGSATDSLKAWCGVWRPDRHLVTQGAGHDL